ncbi:PD-(D/E)XK nuclease family protein [Nafulsella turpanensis]|uniref:PD-(D/E)XK nuclease family protein n=1 Tax=Nafulsella turpanensis TaxID=1265690 RepID=UPI0003461B38|nr:PD-(D/E)XK nuclease family protein [Nafulsella turpanensis]
MKKREEDIPMKPFLEEMAEEIAATFPHQLDELVFVFPNKRAGLFFQKYLAAKIQAPVWSPAVMPIEGFIRSLSPTRQADTSFLVFELFRIYKELASTEESFDKFFFWGEMLLSDFDTVDKYLADAEMLFVNITQLKEMDTSLDYLLPEQIEIIRSFWESFGTERSRHQNEFIAIWEILLETYQRFRQRLEKEGIGYEGLIHREVAEKAIIGELKHTHKQVIFAGFDALTPAEERIIEYFVKHEDSLVYWNVDAYYMLDERQEAGSFLRAYANHRVLGHTFRQPYKEYLQNPAQPKHIEFVGVPLEVGQTKAMGEKLLECLQQQSSINLEKTAIVLPEEHMLFPALHAIPEHFTLPDGSTFDIDRINVTMGYPLRNTPLYSLMETLLDLQQSLRSSGKSTVFHYRRVLSILRHPYVYYFDSGKARKNIEEIERRNKVYLSAKTLEKDEQLYPAIFRKVEKVNDAFDYLLDILLAINSSIDEENYEQPTLEQEYIYQFFTQLKRLRELIGQQSVELSLPVFLKLFRQILVNLRLPFSGEPLRGLQIMGILETRNLDFENLFILSANEGSFPPAPGHNSFIPYNLRRGYGLPTSEREDAIYAYIFFSMIQRAKNVHIFYNTETGFNMNGEMSRYLYQLLFESGLPIHRQVLSNQAQLAKSLPVEIAKTPEVLKILQKYVVRQNGSYSRLTPSALNTYLDCRLRFYYKYIAGISEADEVQEDVNAMVFGNLLHRSMELVYKQFMQEEGRELIEPEDFPRLKKLADAVIDQTFQEHYGETEAFDFEGKNLIVRSVVRKFINAILSCDQQYAPFEIISLEADEDKNDDTDTSTGFKLDLLIQPEGEQPVSIGLKGIIDRVDRKEDKVRVIDYKTGKDTKRFISIPSLFDREDPKRNKAVMQTLFYGLLYLNKHPEEDARVIPGLYNSKELFSKGFDVKLEIQVARNKYEPIHDLKPMVSTFRSHLLKLLEEIFSSVQPFNQTEDLKKCGYCQFRGLCHR